MATGIYPKRPMVRQKEKRRSLKTIARFFGIILLFVVFNGCLPIKRQKETYATFLKFEPFASGGDSYWEFYDGDKRYEVVAWKPYHKITGDKYLVIYDSLKPGKHYRIQSGKPLFVEGEITGKTTCTVTREGLLIPGKDGSVEYEYVVNSVTYKNENGVPERNDTLFLKIGDKFEVEYWMENPQRSIIHVDKPM